MKKVSELEGATLALWTARALGHDTDAFLWKGDDGKEVVNLRATDKEPFMPHEDWKDGAPLVDQIGIGLHPDFNHETGKPESWQAQGWAPYACHRAPQALVAICRVIVERVYGREVPA